MLHSQSHDISHRNESEYLNKRMHIDSFFFFFAISIHDKQISCQIGIIRKNKICKPLKVTAHKPVY